MTLGKSSIHAEENSYFLSFSETESACCNNANNDAALHTHNALDLGTSHTRKVCMPLRKINISFEILLLLHTGWVFLCSYKFCFAKGV